MMKSVFRHFANATLIGLLLFIVFQAINFFNGGSMQVNAAFWRHFRDHMIFSWLIYLANALLISYLLTRFGLELFRGKNLVLSVFGNIAVSLTAIFLARFIISAGFGGNGFLEFIKGESVGYYLNTLILAVFISGIFYAVFYYKHRQETKVKQQKIIAGTASAQFDALKNQLDPHFLFNSLNVLTSLIEEDPQKAQGFTTSLSKVYRYVLEQKNKELVPVDEEFAFARTYVRLLKMRFEEGIHFEIPERSADPEARIVPLSLQLLLENAVKHNVVTPQRPLHIRVTEEAGYVVVTNNLQEKQVISKSSGVGLQNILQRYSLLTERQLKIEKDETRFRVAVPMLSRQVTRYPSQQEFIEDKRFEKAREKVEALKSFYGNLGAYLLVIPFLAWLNWKTTGFAFPWVVFPAMGWGFGLLMHGMEAYGYNPLWGKRWEERKIRELMEKEDF
jgi:hypothetical protein